MASRTLSARARAGERAGAAGVSAMASARGRDANKRAHLGWLVERLSRKGWLVGVVGVVGWVGGWVGGEEGTELMTHL